MAGRKFPPCAARSTNSWINSVESVTVESVSCRLYPNDEPRPLVDSHSRPVGASVA